MNRWKEPLGATWAKNGDCPNDIANDLGGTVPIFFAVGVKTITIQVEEGEAGLLLQIQSQGRSA